MHLTWVLSLIILMRNGWFMISTVNKHWLLFMKRLAFPYYLLPPLWRSTIHGSSLKVTAKLFQRQFFSYLSWYFYKMANGHIAYDLWWPSSQEPNATTGDWYKSDWYYRSVKWKLKSGDSSWNCGGRKVKSFGTSGCGSWLHRFLAEWLWAPHSFSLSFLWFKSHTRLSS